MTYPNWMNDVARHFRRRSTRRELLAMSDRRLEDLGFSRSLLDEGLGAWPWREEALLEDGFRPARREQAERRAIRELEQYSDRELADLGLSRVGIVEAVRHGRAGVEEDLRTAA